MIHDPSSPRGAWTLSTWRSRPRSSPCHHFVNVYVLLSFGSSFSSNRKRSPTEVRSFVRSLTQGMFCTRICTFIFVEIVWRGSTHEKPKQECSLFSLFQRHLLLYYPTLVVADDTMMMTFCVAPTRFFVFCFGYAICRCRCRCRCFCCELEDFCFGGTDPVTIILDCERDAGPVSCSYHDSPFYYLP